MVRVIVSDGRVVNEGRTVKVGVVVEGRAVAVGLVLVVVGSTAQVQRGQPQGTGTSVGTCPVGQGPMQAVAMQKRGSQVEVDAEVVVGFVVMVGRVMGRVRVGFTELMGPHPQVSQPQPLGGGVGVAMKPVGQAISQMVMGQ